MRGLSKNDLDGVTGGLTVSQAGANLVQNVASWGRGVWGRNLSGFQFGRDSTMPVDTYKATLERYDIPPYKPVIPTENKW